MQCYDKIFSLTAEQNQTLMLNTLSKARNYRINKLVL